MANAADININMGVDFNSAIDGAKQAINTIGALFNAAKKDVKIGMDTSGVTTGLEKVKSLFNTITPSVKPKVDTTDTNKAFESIKEKAHSTFSSIGKTALGVFSGQAMLGAVQKLTGSIDDIWKSGVKASERMENLRAGFKQAGASAAEMEGLLKANAGSVEQLSNKYAVGKGAINEYTAVYLKMGGASKDLGKVQEAILGISKKGNIEYEQAAKMLAKASNPEIGKNMKNIGINLQGVKGEANILNTVLAQTSGSLEGLKEHANSPIGNIEKLKNAMSGIKSALGTSLIEIVQPIASLITNQLLPVIKGITTVFKEVATGIAKALSDPKIIGAITNILSAVTGIVTSLMPVISNVLQSLIPVVAQIMDAILPIITNLASMITPLLQPIMNVISSLTPLISSILTPIMELLPTIATIITDVFNAVIPLITTLTSSLIPILAGVFSQLLPPIVNIINVLFDDLMPIFNTIISFIGSLFESLTPLIGQLIPIIVEYLNMYGNIIKEVMPLIRDLVFNILAAIKPILDTLINNLGVFLQMFQDLMPIIQIMAQLFGVVLKAAIMLISGALQLLTPIIEAVSFVFQNLAKAVGSVVGVVGNAIKSIGSALGIIDDEVVKTETTFEKLGGSVKTSMQNSAMAAQGFSKNYVAAMQNPLKTLREFINLITIGMTDALARANDKAKQTLLAALNKQLKDNIITQEQYNKAIKDNGINVATITDTEKFGNNIEKIGTKAKGSKGGAKELKDSLIELLKEVDNYKSETTGIIRKSIWESDKLALEKSIKLIEQQRNINKEQLETYDKKKAAKEEEIKKQQEEYDKGLINYDTYRQQIDKIDAKYGDLGSRQKYMDKDLELTKKKIEQEKILNLKGVEEDTKAQLEAEDKKFKEIQTKTRKAFAESVKNQADLNKMLNQQLKEGKINQEQFDVYKAFVDDKNNYNEKGMLDMNKIEETLAVDIAKRKEIITQNSQNKINTITEAATNENNIADVANKKAAEDEKYKIAKEAADKQMLLLEKQLNKVKTYLEIAAEYQKAYADKQGYFTEKLNAGLSATFSSLGKMLSEGFGKELVANQKIMATWVKASEDSTGKLSIDWKTVGDVASKSLGLIAIQGFKAAVDGENWGKAMLVAVIDVCEKMIIAMSAAISVKDLLTSWDAWKDLATIAAAVVALEGVKAGIGAEAGTSNVGTHTGKRGITDTVPMWLAPKEAVIRAESLTNKDRKMIDIANREKRSLSEVVMDNSGRLIYTIPQSQINFTRQINAHYELTKKDKDSLINEVISMRKEVTALRKELNEKKMIEINKNYRFETKQDIITDLKQIPLARH